jgi:hypothetical protein
VVGVSHVEEELEVEKATAIHVAQLFGGLAIRGLQTDDNACESHCKVVGDRHTGSGSNRVQHPLRGHDGNAFVHSSRQQCVIQLLILLGDDQRELHVVIGESRVKS